VELLLLPADVCAAPDVTAATPGVRLLHSRLPAQVRKSKVDKEQPGAAAGAGSTRVHQQQQAGEVGASQGQSHRYSYSINTVGAGTRSMASMATGGRGDCWLAGISKLGQWHVRLMLSLQQPLLRTQRGLVRSLSTVSQQGEAAAAADEDDGTGDDMQQQQGVAAGGDGTAAEEVDSPFIPVVRGTVSFCVQCWGACELLLLSAYLHGSACTA
jgi:hypothetical protein